MIPHARVDGLIVVEQDGGLLIRDTRTQAEHSLHPLTAFVWKHADGRTTVAQIADRVRAALGADVTNDHVWAAIDVLTGAGLIENRVAPPAGIERFGRRDLLRQVAAGTVAAAAVGALASEAQAASKPAPGGAGHEAAAKVGAEDQQKRSEEERSKRSAAHQEETNKRFSEEQSNKAFPGGKRLPLTDGWVNVAGDFQEAAWSHTADLVVLAGVVQPVSGATSHIATLPRRARPAGALVFGCYYLDGGRDSVARVDVLPDGRVVMVSGLNGTTALSLSGIVYRKVQPRHVDEPGEGVSEQDSKDSAAQEEADKAQERDAKQAQEQIAKGNDQETAQKESADKEQESKAAAEQQSKEQAAKAQQEQAAKAQQEQAAKAQEKQAKEANAKSAEQNSKEEASKEQGSKEQNTKEQGSKEQGSKETSSKEQNSKEQNSKEQNSKEQNSKEQLQKNQEQQSKEQQSKEQASKEQAVKQG